MQHGDYTVGWICALSTELAAAAAMLDERDVSLPQDSRDHNNYTLGRIGVHNVAIACLPAGVTGITSAAIVATHIQYTFPSIRFGLMVGVGGGAPSVKTDIRLGDVVVSKPDETSGGVIQYDFGKTVQEGRFMRTGSLNRPPTVLLSAVNTLQARHRMEEPELRKHLAEMTSKYPKMQGDFTYPGEQHDQVFEAQYNHQEGEDTCANCNSSHTVSRSIRCDNSVPGVHYGLIASANQVMTHAATREKIRQEHNVLCFEMEAAGLMDDFPTLVIRGICNYADTHKNKRWQPYAAAVAAAYAKELLYVIPAKQVVGTQPIRETSAQGDQRPPVKPLFTVPFRQDPKFVDRESIFSQIGEHIRLHHCASLSGMGGNGKSQIAIEYAYRYQKSHPQSHVFWIYAANETQFVQAYQDIARKLRLPGCEDSNVNSCELVARWLDEDDSSGWLMILDSADNADMFGSSDLNASSAETDPIQRSLIDHVPKRLDSQRTLIVTTRNREVGENLIEGESCIEIPRFSIPEAESLLRYHAENAFDKSEPAVSGKLLNTLGYVPLAITQAAAFIKRNLWTVQGYLEAIGENQQNLIDHLSQELQDTRRPRGFPNSVFRTWKLSFDQILSQEPRTAELVAVIAMLDPQRIPKKLLRPLAEREVDFRMAIGTLSGFALISHEIDGETYSIHPLVQASLHYWLEQRSQKVDFASQALQLLADEFPDGRYEHRETCESMLAHAQVVLCHECVSENHIFDRAFLLYNVGYFSHQQGRYASAYGEAFEAYTIYKEFSGEDAWNTLNSLCLLVLVLRDQGEYDIAEKMSRQAQKGYEKTMGTEHPATLFMVDGMATVYWRQGKYKKAEKLYRRALEGREKTLGLEHVNTLSSVNNLALVLQVQGDHKTAEKLFRQAIQGYEALGIEHPNTWNCVQNLALLLRSQGEYEAAEELYRKALEGKEKTLGMEHPRTLPSVHHLAYLFHTQKRYHEASVLYCKASAGFIKTLGPDHPWTRRCSRHHSSMLREMEENDRDAARPSREDSDGRQRHIQREAKKSRRRPGFSYIPKLLRPIPVQREA